MPRNTIPSKLRFRTLFNGILTSILLNLNCKFSFFACIYYVCFICDLINNFNILIEINWYLTVSKKLTGPSCKLVFCNHGFCEKFTSDKTNLISSSQFLVPFNLTCLKQHSFRHICSQRVKSTI